MDEAPHLEGLEPTPASLARDRVCVVRLRRSLFGILGKDSRGICKIDKCTRIPRTPGYLVGITNLRGNVAPVLDLGPPLSLPPRSGENLLEDGLVVDMDGSLAILAADEIVAFEPAVIDPLNPLKSSSPAAAEFSVGQIEYRGESVAVLDISKLTEAIKIRSQAHPRSEATRVDHPPGEVR